MKKFIRLTAIMLAVLLPMAMSNSTVFGISPDSSMLAASTLTLQNRSTTSTSCNTLDRIIAIANTEAGASNGGTKYQTWYGEQLTWCAIFVAWCANQAGVPSSVIERTASPVKMQEKFAVQSRYYDSASRGGTVTPQPGDIFLDRLRFCVFPCWDYCGCGQ